MIQYIYFLKCPNCADEPFDFFDEAKASALSCLSSKPIITQVEVDRNDFGECTDSKDLGTIWSWENEVKVADEEPAANVFTKGDFAEYNPDDDPEFDTIDNSLDFNVDDIPDNFHMPITEGFVNKFVIVGEYEDYTKQFYNAETATWVAGVENATLYDDRNDAIIVLSDLDTSEFYTTNVMIKPTDAIEVCNRKLVEGSFISKYDYDQMTKDEFYHHLVDQGNTVEIAVGTQSNYGASFADNGVYSDSVLEVKFKDELFSIVMWSYSDDGDISEDTGYEFSTKSFDELWEEIVSFKPEALHEASKNTVLSATRTPKDSDFVIVLKSPTTGRHSFFGTNYRMTSDLNKAMTYSGKFLAEEDIKYAADISSNSMTSDTSFVEDRFFVTTVAEAKKLQGKFETKAQHQDRIATENRKPIPEGMTIEQLVEEMEENEDTVECTWCNELFDKSECRYEVDLGYLCHSCEAAIKSRGETLTFRENNYWDFLDEDVELEEAGNSKYNFKYLHYNEHAKNDIIDKADLHPVTCRYVYGNTIKVPFAITDVQDYPPYKTVSRSAGVITNFTIENGTIMFDIENNGKTYSQDFKTVIGRAAKKSTTADFLNAFYSIVKEVNKGSNLGISRNRDFDFTTSVKKSPMLAEELRNHIIKVQYEIPLTKYTAEDLLAAYDKSGTTITRKDEQDANKAADNLVKIYDNFFNGWKYGDAAEAAGLVVDRPVLREDAEGVKLCDTLYFIGTKWHAVGKITFDCPVGQLTEKTRSLIQDAKLDGNIDDLLNKKEIDCIRLAYALTSYFDDVKFYENFSDNSTGGFDTITTEREPELLTASLDKKSFLEELEESDVYRSRLTLCPECGENEFDPDTGICGNCGFNIL